jgi:hypothetical protein
MKIRRMMMPPVEPLNEEEEIQNAPVAEEGDSNDFSDLAEELLSDDQVEDYGVEAATEEPEGTEPEAETPGGAEKPEGEEPPLAAEADATVTPEPSAPTEPPTPEVEAAAPAEPEVQIEESEEPPEVEVEPSEPDKSYDALRTEALEELQDKTFALSEEDAQTLVTEPEKILPKLAANVYMAAYENVTKSIMASLPQMIAQTMSQQTAVETATDAFYTKWGKLDRNNAKHSSAVNRIAKVYRQVNPKASAEQFTAEVGAQTLLALGIPFEEIIDAPPTEIPKPFQPAAPSGAVRTPPPAAVTNEWTDLAEELIDDDNT